jgi:ABC-type maltose transport system permease subunit
MADQGSTHTLTQVNNSQQKQSLTSLDGRAEIRFRLFDCVGCARGAALLAALPTLIVYFALQRQFVRGLTLGATKG